MDALPSVVANALRGRALGSAAQNIGLECLKLMGDRLLRARGQDQEDDIEPACAMPLGANERAALWQAAKWINEGIAGREPRKLEEALAELQRAGRDGSVPVDTAAIPPEALRCTDEDLWDDVRTFCEVFGARLPAGR